MTLTDLAHHLDRIARVLKHVAQAVENIDKEIER